MTRKKAFALDARLDAEIPALRQPVGGGPELWNRIETALAAEKARGASAAAIPREAPEAHRRSFGVLRNLGKRWILVPAGAAALFLIALVTLLITRSAAPSSGILTARALARVETIEKEYLTAIGDLEKMAGPKIKAMDLQLVFLYRDKLAAIDSQIAKCREALDSNPANAHIRRYLLAALSDKRQTLAEILGPGTPVPDERSNS
jgi:hypothetical protein